MKLTVGKVRATFQALVAMDKYPKAPYGFSTNMRRFQTVVENSEKDVNDLFTKFTTGEEGQVAKKKTIDNGASYLEWPEGTEQLQKQFEEEVQRIMDEEVEVNVYQILRSKFDGCEVPTSLLAQFEDFIIVDEIT